MEEIRALGFHDNGFRVFGVNFFKILKEHERKLGRQAVRSVLKANLKSTWKGVVVSFLNGTETARDKTPQLLRLYWSYPEAWIAAFFFLLPKPALSFLYKTYKFIK